MAAKEPIVDDLARAILELLPDEGAKLGKYLADSRDSGRLKKELDDPHVTAAMVGRRIAELRRFELVVPAGASGGHSGWQRTAKGKRFLDKVSGDGS